ncbi:MAG: hypothetical protein ACRD2W_18210 [Acidimicrobiales bacterium]
MRGLYQRSDGRFAATASKTLAVPVGVLYEAFADGESRSGWLPDVKVNIRVAHPRRTLGWDWGTDGERIEVYFAAKADEKVQCRHPA